MLNKIGVFSSEVLIKSHPALPIDEFKHLLPKHARLVNENTYKLFEKTKILIGAASGTLVEAISLGIPVITIKESDDIEYNYLPQNGKGIIWEEVSKAEELKQQIEKFEYSILNNSKEMNNIASNYKRNFFCEPNEKNISKCFDL